MSRTGQPPTREPGPAPIVVLVAGPLPFRNVAHSDFLPALGREGAAAHLIVEPGLGREAEARHGALASWSPLLDAPTVHPRRGIAACDTLVRAAFAHRHGLTSQGIFDRWDHRGEPLLGRARRTVLRGAAPLVSADPVYTALHNLAERRRWGARDLSGVTAQLTRLAPALLVSTGCVYAAERPYLEAARRLGIPVVGWIASFDNLTSRSRLPTFDWYIAWNDRMAGWIRTLTPAIPPGAITICGTPQFDILRGERDGWTRAATLGRLGLAPGSRYVLYGANHARFTPTEPELVSMLGERMRADSELAGLDLVVRPHPLDDPRRWDALRATGNRLHLSRPFLEGETGLVDEGLLAGSIAHAEACVSMASTLSLDSAVLDTPAISVAFAARPGSTEDAFYAAAHRSDHFAPLAEADGLALARSMDELLAELRRATRDRAAGRAARARLVAEECGTVDGGAAGRIAGHLAALRGRG